ncbi:MAG: hypothetical protein ACPGXK_02405, partial [Phycisphaerae bacterium]
SSSSASAALSGATVTKTFITLTCDRGQSEECGDGCPTCFIDEDCNDENVCTIDACVLGNCIYEDVSCEAEEVCDPLSGCPDEPSGE